MGTEEQRVWAPEPTQTKAQRDCNHQWLVIEWWQQGFTWYAHDLMCAKCELRKTVLG
jgi:hypothetical protein